MRALSVIWRALVTVSHLEASISDHLNISATGILRSDTSQILGFANSGLEGSVRCGLLILDVFHEALLILIAKLFWQFQTIDFHRGRVERYHYWVFYNETCRADDCHARSWTNQCWSSLSRSMFQQRRLWRRRDLRCSQSVFKGKTWKWRILLPLVGVWGKWDSRMAEPENSRPHGDCWLPVFSRLS